MPDFIVIHNGKRKSIFKDEPLPLPRSMLQQAAMCVCVCVCVSVCVSVCMYVFSLSPVYMSDMLRHGGKIVYR